MRLSVSRSKQTCATTRCHLAACMQKARDTWQYVILSPKFHERQFRKFIGSTCQSPTAAKRPMAGRLQWFGKKVCMTAAPECCGTRNLEAFLQPRGAGREDLPQESSGEVLTNGMAPRESSYALLQSLARLAFLMRQASLPGSASQI
jgi:hypothetical protein